MNFIVPAIAIIYGAYLLYSGQTDPDMDTNLKYWVQTLGATGGGLGVLIANYWTEIKSWIPFLGKKTEALKVEPESAALLPTSLEDRDYECIVHLRNRFTVAGSKEGLELTKKVNDLLFTISIDNVPTKDVKEVKKNA